MLHLRRFRFLPSEEIPFILELILLESILFFCFFLRFEVQ